MMLSIQAVRGLSRLRAASIVPCVTDRQNRSIGATCALDKEIKKTNNSYSGKLGIRPDHPRRRIEMQFDMVGDLWVLVLSFKVHQNQLSGYQDVRGQILA